MNTTFIDVHTFDGTWGNNYIKINDLNNDEKGSLITDFKNKLKNPVAKHMINIIMNSSIGNYDNANETNVVDILTDILLKDTSGIIDYIEEQLIDCFMLGQCPQGRTTRLYQIWLSLYGNESQ